MNHFEKRFWTTQCTAACAALTLVAATAGSAFASEVPWYKRLFRGNKGGQAAATQAIKTPAPLMYAPAAPATTAPKSSPAPIRSYKSDPSALEVDDALPGLADTKKTLAMEATFDLSEEMSPADRHLKREFPMPQPQMPQPPRVPPTPDQYRVPQAAPSPAPQAPSSSETDR